MKTLLAAAVLGVAVAGSAQAASLTVETDSGHYYRHYRPHEVVVVPAHRHHWRRHHEREVVVLRSHRHHYWHDDDAVRSSDTVVVRPAHRHHYDEDDD